MATYRDNIRFAGNVQCMVPPELPVYTTGTLPTVTGNDNKIIIVSDAACKLYVCLSGVWVPVYAP